MCSKNLIIFLIILSIINVSSAYHNITAICEFYNGPEDFPACLLTNAFVTISEQNLEIRSSRFLRWDDEKITYLSAIDSVLNFIPPIIFTKYCNIEKLILENVYVRNIQRFKNCGKIVYLSLGRNFLSTLPDGVFEECPEIKEINLSNNGINLIASDTFRGLEKLEKLNLENNKLDANTPKLSSITSLKTLNLASNFFITLSIDLIENLNISKLDLPDNDLIKIPSNFFKNSQFLRELYLNENKLSNTENSAFAHLQNLHILHLQNNEISTIRKQFFANLTNLEELRLDNNKLKFIDNNAFDDLIILKALNLSWNRFASVNTSPRMHLAKLENLETLDLSHNSIHFIDKGFELTPTLKTLLLDYNKIYFLHSSVFKPLINLEMLKIDHNDLPYLANDIFLYNENLKFLDLSNNKLKIIEHQLIANLISLGKLNLSNNLIDKISSEFDNYFNEKIIIDLRGNECIDAFIQIDDEHSVEDDDKEENIFTFCYENFLNLESEPENEVLPTTLASRNETLDESGCDSLYNFDFIVKLFLSAAVIRSLIK